MRGNRRAPGPTLFGQGGWSGCAGHGFSRRAREYGLFRIGPLQFRDSCFLRFGRQLRVSQAPAACAAGQTAREAADQAPAFQAPTTVDVRRASEDRNRRRTAARRQVLMPQLEALAAKGDASRHLTARPHAIHPPHAEARRQTVLSGQDRTEERPSTSGLRRPTTQSAGPLVPRRWLACRRVGRGQPRKESPHRSRNSSLTPAVDPLLRSKR
jgi:hypothetical protein